MASYDEFSKNELVPTWVKELVTVGLAVSAIVLYGGILAAALYRTVASDPPFITYGMERAAAMLGGLIGTVVTAGFAQGRRTASVQARGLRPVGARPPSLWERLDAGSLVQGKMLGLARTVGLPVISISLASLAADQAGAPVGAPTGAPASTTQSNKLSMWMAIVYFVVYFVVGLGALGLTLVWETVPDMIANTGWVWLGTMISAGYAFFGVNSD